MANATTTPELTSRIGGEPPASDYAQAAPDRPEAFCGCGHILIWCAGEWQHNAAPYLWGDDHDPHAPAPAAADPGRLYWDKNDGVT